MKIKSKIKSYNAKEYFESWHKSIFNSEFSDRVTISPTTNHLISNYHYNLVENNIYEYLIIENVEKDVESFLDIGSGAGHWIDFFKGLLKIKNITSFEISDICVDELKNKYKENSNIEVIECDVSDENISKSSKFDLISAIGVMFHIVEDDKWKTAIQNLSLLLKQKGIAFIGGEFGDKTEDKQFNAVNNFSTWKQRQLAWDNFKNSKNEMVYVNKRVRSFDFWKKEIEKNSLIVKGLIKSDSNRKIKTPENNILVVQKI